MAALDPAKESLDPSQAAANTRSAMVGTLEVGEGGDEVARKKMKMPRRHLPHGRRDPGRWGGLT